MSDDRFAAATSETFAFLDERGFERRESRWRVDYRNATTLVSVALSPPPEAELGVRLTPAEGGEAIELGALLEARGAPLPPENAMPADPHLPEALEAWAAALREHAEPLLRGDFEGLDDARAVQRRRREEFEGSLAEMRERAAERHANAGWLRRLWSRLP